jgi:hypothetical protein
MNYIYLTVCKQKEKTFADYLNRKRFMHFSRKTYFETHLKPILERLTQNASEKKDFIFL